MFVTGKGSANVVAIARPLLAVALAFVVAPRLLIAVNPPRGIDVGSALFVHERLLELRGGGAALLLFST